MPVAIVTGGTRGIGLAVARELAARDLDLVLGHWRDHEAAERAREALVAAGVRVKVVAGDIKEAATHEALVEAGRALGGQLVAVVANAGYAIPASLPGGFTEAQYDEAQQMAPKAFLGLVERSLPHLPDGRGRIVAISSLGVHEPSSVYAVAAPAKAALEVLVRHYALALAPRGIAVNAVVPGYVRTDAWDGFRSAMPDLDDLPPRVTPMGRWGEPEDLAPLVAFLCSAESGFLTGQRIAVDGGLSLSLLWNAHRAARALEG